MENNNELDKLLRKALAVDEEINVPSVDRMKLARQAVAARANTTEARQDLITFVASFLNMKVKLYYVVILFVLVWISYLVVQKEPGQSQEGSPTVHESGLAATNNSTVLCTIRTYCLKK